MKKIFLDYVTNEEIKPGDRVTLAFDFPKDLSYIGRADKVLENLLNKNNGEIRIEKDNLTH
jgi:hypothetical protein